jgi:predicted phosphodiesterase
MKLLVISDLHIADNKNLSTFGWDQRAFIEKLKAIGKSHSIDMVVLNGDTFDLYKSNFNDIVARNKDLIDYLQRIGAIFIKGNHDKVLGFGQDQFVIVNSKKQKIHIEHGHRGDFINGTAVGRFMGKVFYMALKLLARLSITRRLYFHCLEHEEGFKGHGKYNSYKYLRYAVKLLRKNDMVVLGHTHTFEVHDTYRKNEKKRYINCGSCSFGRFQGVVIDTETLSHETIRIHTTYAPAPLRVVRPLSTPPKKRIRIGGAGNLVPA